MIEHKTFSLADQVFDRLEADILSGKYKRGEFLTELKLSQSLGVSRTPVREALRRLAGEHIIEESPKGAVVVGLTSDDIDDIYALRKEIEGMAVARAAERITDEEIEKLKELIDLQEFYANKNDADHIKAMDNQFHQFLYRFSGSAVIYDTLMPLHKKTQKYRKASVENRIRAEQSLKEHRAILDALIKRDKKLAKEKTVEHIKNAYDSIKEKEV